MVLLNTASLLLLTVCLVAAEDAEGPSKRQASTQYLGAPQAARYLGGDAYQQHQARLSASFAQEHELDPATQARIEAELHRDAVANAKSAAESFKSSWSQRGQQPQQQQVYAQAPQQQIYAQAPQQQYYAPTPTPQRAAPQQVYAPTPAPQQVYAPTPAPQQAVQYRTAPAVQRVPTDDQASLQHYQARANLAEQAAQAFQEALQQGGRAQGGRPRLNTNQYILEQQHSYVTPQQQQTPEEYNLAAVQQAYQQIEQQQRTAVDKIHAQAPAARPVALLRATAAPAAPEVPTYEEPSGYNVGDGPSNFEPARQRGQRKYQTQPAAPEQAIPQTVEIKARRPSTVRSRPVAAPAPAPRAPLPTYQTETFQAPVSYEAVQAYQPTSTAAPQPPAIYQQAVEVPRAPARQQVQIPARPVQIPVQQPVQIPAQSVFLPTPVPAVTRVAAPVRVAAPAPAPRVPVASATPIPSNAIPPQAELVDGKLVNLDLNLLRSLYSAAETLAKKQKDDVGPITENDLIKALLEQGRREQQAAEILQKAAEKPEPEAPKVEVVRIPKTKQPITSEELQALINAGYDITPLEEAPSASNADPIRQQYLRQAEFLERQALYRMQKGSSRRVRDESSSSKKDEVAKE